MTVMWLNTAEVEVLKIFLDQIFLNTGHVPKLKFDRHVTANSLNLGPLLWLSNIFLPHFLRNRRKSPNIGSDHNIRPWRVWKIDVHKPKKLCSLKIYKLKKYAVLQQFRLCSFLISLLIGYIKTDHWKSRSFQFKKT
jgi:hypothetical protein